MTKIKLVFSVCILLTLGPNKIKLQNKTCIAHKISFSIKKSKKNEKQKANPPQKANQKLVIRFWIIQVEKHFTEEVRNGAYKSYCICEASFKNQ